jgi:pimeloyl-ACP methyl ester carboxylesterase
MTPDWFTAALAVPVQEGSALVDGAEIAYRAWGKPGRPGMVLVHGGAANSRWWDHVAPQLAGDRRVVAIDLSGHGDSARRVDYKLDTWAREVFEVAEHAGIAGPATVIGHSLGGFVTLRTASLYGDRLAGAVVVDSPVRELTPEEDAALKQRAFGPLRVYPTAADAIARFRPVPDDGSALLSYVVKHIAKNSIRAVPGGFSWKFDPHVFNRQGPLSPSLVTRLDCRIALFRGERGMLSQQMSDVLYDRLGRVAPVIEIPDAGHHVMLDQPLSLITGVRTLLSDWDHSVPAAETGIPGT